MVDVGDIVGLVFAVFFAVAVLALCYLIVKLTKVVEETQRLVEGITRETVPLLGQVNQTVTSVNGELVRVDAITANVQSMTGNISSLTSLFAATLGSPIIKVAAFSYGVRQASSRRQADEVTKRVKAEMKSDKRGSTRL